MTMDRHEEQQPPSLQDIAIVKDMEEVLVIRPHLLGDSAQGYLLLNLREDEKLEEVLENKDEEEEESEVDAKSQGSQRVRSTHACDMVMTMGWNETQTQTQTS